MKKYQVVFISTPGIGCLVPTVKLAQLLTNRDPRLSATVFLITLPQRHLVNSYVHSLSSSSSRIHFVHLPSLDPPSPHLYQSSIAFISLVIQQHTPHVAHAIRNLIRSESESGRVSGIFFDMFCTLMIDIANDLGVPSYLFMASPASYLGFTIQLPILENQLTSEFVDSATEFVVPSFANPLPSQVLPNVTLNRKLDGYSWYLAHSKRYSEAKGIVVNTCRELEAYAVTAVSASGGPPVYPVGPVLDLAGPVHWHPDREEHTGIIKWLDDQPVSSVVFMCFGSMGSLSVAQLQETANGLERTGFRFLWSIREPPKSKLDLPGEYTNLKEILPEGFLDRTAGVGLVCGWVPQVTVLAHQSIGGFVSHCGWNSILESLWYGVPIATWPIYAEQQMNAFLMVKELGLAVEIRLDYREGSELVSADEVESGINRLMGGGGEEVRRKVKGMSRKCRVALMENGSSYLALASLIEKLTAE